MKADKAIYSGFLRQTCIIIAFIVMNLAYPSAANADWREEIGVFRIGIVSEDRGQGSLFRYEPFKEAISSALGMEVEFFQASGTEPLIDALSSGRIEYALMSSAGFALGWTICECIEPIVLPRAQDSTDSYRLIAIARSSQDMELEKLADYRIAFASRGAITGRPLVQYLLGTREPPIKFDDNQVMQFTSGKELQEAFGKEQFDVLFGWSSMTGFPKDGYSRGTLRQLVEAGTNGAGRLSVIWQSEPIAHRPHVIRKNLPGELKSTLRRVLLGMGEANPQAYDSIEPVYAGGFAAVTPEKYAPLIRFMAEIKKNRATPEALPGESSGQKLQDGEDAIRQTD